MTANLYKVVAARAGYCCEYCHAPEALFNHRFPVDHIMPRVFGGSDDLDNLALACHACNSHKYQKQMAFDPRRKKSSRLFNPRRDKWQTHFTWNHSKTRIIGRTAVGRAPVGALNLNSERQIEARILWQLLKKSRTGR